MAYNMDKHIKFKSMADWDLISSYVGLLVLAIGSIYAGAFGSLSIPRKDEQQESSDRLSASEAWLFPIVRL